MITESVYSSKSKNGTTKKAARAYEFCPECKKKTTRTGPQFAGGPTLKTCKKHHWSVHFKTGASPVRISSEAGQAILRALKPSRGRTYIKMESKVNCPECPRIMPASELIEHILKSRPTGGNGFRWKAKKPAPEAQGSLSLIKDVPVAYIGGSQLPTVFTKVPGLAEAIFALSKYIEGLEARSATLAKVMEGIANVETAAKSN